MNVFHSFYFSCSSLCLQTCWNCKYLWCWGWRFQFYKLRLWNFWLIKIFRALMQLLFRMYVRINSRLYSWLCIQNIISEITLSAANEDSIRKWHLVLLWSINLSPRKDGGLFRISRDRQDASTDSCYYHYLCVFSKYEHQFQQRGPVIARQVVIGWSRIISALPGSKLKLVY